MQADVAVVGAGPGGMAAALAAADAGCRVTLIDSAPRVGGQIYRQRAAGALTPPTDGVLTPPTGGALTPLTDGALAPPARLRRVAVHPRITVLSGATVWHACREDSAFVLRHTPSPSAAEASAVTAHTVVLAAGAAELVLPFPGWTLPGVITAGAAQALLKAQDILPGRRVLVAGTGPLLLRAAADLIRRGATVVAVCEASGPARSLSGLPAAMRHPGKLAEASGYATTLARARVRMLSGWAVTACHGDGRVEQAQVVRVDGSWRAAGRGRAFAVDAVAVSHGLVPALDLPRALGCLDEQLPRFPAAVVAVDGGQATSVPGVFACGELTGIGGAGKAEPEGQLAGLAAARYLGLLGQTSFRRQGRPLAARIRHARHFAALLGRLYPLADGWMDRLRPDTIICRCEEVTFSDLRGAVAAGAGDLRTVKGLTRCGMGYCQGRVCGPVAQYAAARLAGRPLADLGDLHTRHIATPVPLSVLADQGAWGPGGKGSPQAKGPDSAPSGGPA